MSQPRIVLFDVESRKRTSDLNPVDNEAAWADLRSGRGGASAVAIYDTRDSYLYLYDDFQSETIARHLEAAGLVVGFCSEQFDVPCIEGLAGRRLRLRAHYDILTDLVTQCAIHHIARQPGDLTLDRIAKKNLARGKVNHGSNASELAKLGRFGELFNYCADDVHLTRDLLARIYRDGGLVISNGKFITLSPPMPERYGPVMEKYL